MSENRNRRRWSSAERDVLLDVFLRLPSLHLAFSVRGASVAWRALVDDSDILRQNLRRRAFFLESEARKKSERDPFYNTDTLDRLALMNPGTAVSADAQNSSTAIAASANAHPGTQNPELQRCVDVVSAAQLQWDCETVFRAYRQSSLQPLAKMCEFWDSVAAKGVPEMPWAHEVALQTHNSHQNLQMRVLHDCNDRSAEKHVFRVQSIKVDQEDDGEQP